MAISVDWPTGVISVPKSDLALVQSVPTEIREHLIDDLWRECRAAEDSQEGRSWPIICNYNPPTSVGGVELAAVFEITDYYTITYEDGQYAVNLKGMNTNVGDRVNVNQVSIRSSNSAGLVNSSAIEFGEYDGAVTIDQNNVTGAAQNGQAYPSGTLRRPVLGVPDANVIATSRGFDKMKFIGNAILDTGDDVSGFRLIGQNPERSDITVNAGATTGNCEILEATVSGNLDGNTILRDCIISNLNYIEGEVRHCVINPGTISLGGSGVAQFDFCRSGVPGQATPELDCNGLSDLATTALAVRAYVGGLKLIEFTSGAAASLDFLSGQCVIDLSTCNNGSITVRGVCKVVDENGDDIVSGTYNGNLVIHNEAVHGPHVHQTWEYVNRILDLMEADEQHTSTEIVKLLKGTATELQRKNVSGSNLPAPLSIVEAP